MQAGVDHVPLQVPYLQIKGVVLIHASSFVKTILCFCRVSQITGAISLVTTVRRSLKQA
jgi:hypothetical protein